MTSSLRTVGVEEELMLFTPGAQPAPVGEELADDPGTDVEHELKLEQAEIASQPQTELDALVQDLHARREELITAAANRGVLVAGLASSPDATLPTPTPDERYERMHRQYGLIAADQLTCGTHVHVSVASRAEGVAVVDGVRAWTAILLALSANSPFWTGVDTGYASYRTISWGRWPTAGPTETFRDEAGYDRSVAEAVATGAALDPGMIYFDVRLSARYPTVEFRIADVGQQVADSVLLAALCRAAVDTAARGVPFDVPADRLRAAAWRAARFGISDQLVDPADATLHPAGRLVERMLDAFGPALDSTGDRTRVADLVAALWSRGTGADLQRADLAAGGSPLAVVRAAAGRAVS
jgi:glutamate---cysteine ligase / carboxylate-amine ligase